MESQLTILSESLDKKLEVLQKIQEYNKRQEEVFSAEKVDMSLFDDAVEEKQRLIDEVVRLDDGATQHRSGNCRHRWQKSRNSAYPYRPRKPATRN